MSNYFKLISLSHKNADLTIRERIALNETQCKTLIQNLRLFTQLNDILVLSTCNRTEVYYSAPQSYHSEIIQQIAGIHHLSTQEKEDYFNHFQDIESHEEAVQHLFEVAIGLDSQVVGDMQISNQVKTAYQWSADAGTSGAFLHRLMHTIFFTNKKVVQETSFRSGIASTSYAAVELVEELTADIAQPRILLVGLGEIGSDVFLYLKESRFEHITIANRTMEKALEMAKDSHAKVIPFEEIWAEIEKSDVVISSVRTEEPLIHAGKLKSQQYFSFKYFIDLSVPRSIDPALEEVNGLLVYNIDNIQNKTNQALEKRMQSVPDVRAIIQNSIEEFSDWSKEMEVSPTIQKLKNALEQIRLEELDRYMKELSREENEKVDRITKSMMQKIMKLPILQLKAACKRGEAETLIDVLNDLFNLEKQSEKV